MWTRRDFVRAMAAGGVAGALPFLSHGASVPDVDLRLVASLDRAPIFPGAETPILRFSGELIAGRPDALKPSPSFLGPTLDLRRGERIRVHFVNRLPEPSIVHWHGMLVPERADGHPRFAVPSGGTYTYDFVVRNPAGTYFYHPHPHGRTGFQVYYGLAGLITVREPFESGMGLPPEAFELPLVIQDRRVARDNSLAYAGGMMDAMNGMLGDTMLVNGLANAAFPVSPRAYRLRVLNASNARIYKLAWSDGAPITVVGTDGGFLSAAEGVQTRAYVTLAPSERVEIVEDFSRRRPGVEIALVSLPFSSGGGMMGGMMGRGMMGGMMGRGMMGGGGQSDELLLARFAVRREPPVKGDPVRLPAAGERAAGAGVTAYTELGFARMQGFLNGRTFAIDAVAPDERLRVGQPVVWTFANPPAGMMAMPHPMHIHGVQFRILERSGSRFAGRDLAEGIVSVGRKDSFLILPGEQVRVAFTPSEAGLFLYHCHNLEHEDGGMMRNVLFEA